MARVFVTGSASGLGRLNAQALLDGGHDVIVHVRDVARLEAVADLTARGAYAVVGDLSDLDQTRDVAAQVNRSGPVDAVIHNAGVQYDPTVMAVNVIAPYALTALIARPQRLVYLSSGMHHGGRPRLDRLNSSGSYSDSKLFVTALAFAIARRWPDVLSNAVDPGWVPTRMGGPSAPDDLTLGQRTQEWLAVSDEAATTGGYWFHRSRREPHPASRDRRFQDELVEHLSRATGLPL